MGKESTQGIFIFVGENRSKTAVEKGWSWQNCQVTGEPHLSAIPLWKALKGIDLNPSHQTFFNLWDENWKINKYVPEILKEMSEDWEIVAMGQKVHKELEKIGVEHKTIIHPAARGKNRRTDLYNSHIKKILSH